MKQDANFTDSGIFLPLIRFSLPVLLALLLQAMYGAVDLWVVGRFAEAADVSGVATGSQIMHTLTGIVTGLAMGVTIQVGQLIGEGRPERAGKAIGAGVVTFAILAACFTALFVWRAEGVASIMRAPQEAFGQTTAYIRICSAGFVFIIAYNLLGAVFRGIGDSVMPLVTVALACVVNVGADLLLVWGLHLGARGAAWATVLAQAVSVLISLFLIKRRPLPFTFDRTYIGWDWPLTRRILRLGTPISLQDLLVGLSFLLILAIVNAKGLIYSAGLGVGQKLCAFIMLVPAAYMQSMSAFVAQNVGARKPERANKALRYGIMISFATGLIMFWLSFFHGDMLAGIFTRDPEIRAAAFDYLKAYGIDCLLTPFLFCFIGYYNGCGRTLFVMIQGLVGAFGVRIPLAWLFSRPEAATLFQIGLATPCSTVVQILLCLGLFLILRRRREESGRLAAEAELR